MQLKTNELAWIVGLILVPTLGRAAFLWLPDSAQRLVGDATALSLWAALFALVGLLVWTWTRPYHNGVDDVSGGPSSPVRAPEAEAALLAAGWRPLVVLRLRGQTPHDAMFWGSPEGDSFADASVLPTGEHLALTTVRADGTTIVTAWAEPLLDSVHRPYRDRVAVPRDATIFAAHADRVRRLGGVVPTHDRALVLGYLRGSVERLERIERKGIAVVVGLCGSLAAGILVAVRVLPPSGIVAALVGGVVVAGTAAVVLMRPGATGLFDWGRPPPASAMRAADAGNIHPPVLPVVDRPSPTPVAPPGAPDDQHRVLWTLVGVVLLGTLVIVALRLILQR